MNSFSKEIMESDFLQIFYRFCQFFGGFWKRKSTTRSIEVLMNFSITFHIDFGRVCDRLLSRNCILFRRAVMPQVTFVLRERLVEQHRKYRMKMQKSMLCMDHLASISLVTNHRIWVWKRASLGRRI